MVEIVIKIFLKKKGKKTDNEETVKGYARDYFRKFKAKEIKTARRRRKD